MNNHTFLKFGPTVKCIEDSRQDRFMLLNCNNENLDYFPIFKANERDLLRLNNGVSQKDFRTLFPNNKSNEYINFFQRNGYFDPLQNGSDFIDRIRKNGDNHYRATHNEIFRDLESKLKSYHSNQSIPWSTYEPSAGAASLEISLLITDLCNLQCRYCHVIDNMGENSGKVGGKIMSQKTLESFIKQIAAYIKDRFKTGCLKICFFGGQPALKGKVRRFLYNAADYLSKEGAKEEIYIKFIIDDNGTQIDDELISFYKKYHFEVNLSFDAPEDVNSIQRPFLGSSKKSGKIVEGHLQKLLQNEVNVGVRATVSNYNQNRILEAVKKYSEWGLTAAAFIPMQDVAHGKKVFGMTSPDPEIFKNELIKTFDFVLELYESKNILFDFGPLTALLNSIVSGGTTQSCGMGDLYYAVSPDGDLFTCHRDLIPEYFVCSLDDSEFLSKMHTIPESKKCPSFYSLMNPDTLCSDKQCSCKETQKTSCSECEVLIFCGGACPAASFAQYGCVNWGVSILFDSDPSLNENRCRWSKELITHYLWQYLDATDNSPIKQYAQALLL